MRQSSDNVSESGDGDNFANRRRNLKFRTLGSSGDKPLGDREMLLKKKKNADLNSPEDEDVGIFDRFSAARKTLTRNKKSEDPDTKSLNEVSFSEKKSSDWRSRLASKFKKDDKSAEPSLNSYRKTSTELDQPQAPMTERQDLSAIQQHMFLIFSLQREKLQLRS